MYPLLIVKRLCTLLQKVLKKFKSGEADTNEQYPVLLMQYKSSSSGLNIVEANHVIIVEPVLTPATVHQAIGRVDRISQTRLVWPHSLIPLKYIL